jgi:hypothetical protein
MSIEENELDEGLTRAMNFIFKPRAILESEEARREREIHDRIESEKFLRRRGEKALARVGSFSPEAIELAFASIVRRGRTAQQIYKNPTSAEVTFVWNIIHAGAGWVLLGENEALINEADQALCDCNFLHHDELYVDVCGVDDDEICMPLLSRLRRWKCWINSTVLFASPTTQTQIPCGIGRVSSNE